MSLRSLFRIAATTLLALCFAVPASAQIDRLKRRIKRAAEDEVGKKAEQVTRNAVRCALDDAACADRARKDGKTAVFTDADGEIIVDQNGKPVTDPEDAKRGVDQPGTGVWRNYDFVPGAKVWYALDLTDEPIGRFPAKQLGFVSGNGQVVERNGVKMMEFSAATTFTVALPDTLPEDFTIEFDFQAAAPNMGLTVTTAAAPSPNMRSFPGHYLYLYQSSGIARQGAQVSQLNGLWHIATEMVPFKFQVDGGPAPADDYSIVYAGTKRAAQIPNAEFPRGRVIEFRVPANGKRPAYLNNIVIAVHGDPLYQALEKEGTFTTRGILFDFDSDGLRPESTPTLEQLYQALDKHPDLAVVIEGHTDALGETGYNQQLSERRAAAVVAYLVDRGVARGRLSSIGKGETTPVAANDTEAARQQNRRVVIVKRS